MASTKIKIKQSSVTGNVPTASQIDQGELALNTADQKMYSKDSTGAIFEVGAAANTIIEASILAQVDGLMRKHHIVDMGDWDGVVRIDGGDSDDTAFVTNGSYDGGGA